MTNQEIKSKLETIYNDAITWDRENKGVDTIGDLMVGTAVLSTLKKLIDNINKDDSEYYTILKCTSKLNLANRRLRDYEEETRIARSIIEDVIIELVELNDRLGNKPIQYKMESEDPKVTPND